MRDIITKLEDWYESEKDNAGFEDTFLMQDLKEAIEVIQKLRSALSRIAYDNNGCSDLIFTSIAKEALKE